MKQPEDRDSMFFDFPGAELFQRVTAAIRRGAVGFFRQSTMAQFRRNTFSQRVQEEQLDHLAPFGVRREDVRVVLAYGESARRGVVRKRFRELIWLVRRDMVGLIVLARHDRLSRNSEDSEELYRLMREKGVLLMVDGRIYDPTDEGDDFVLTIYSKFSEIENRARTRWLTLTRFAKARALSYRIPLPTGLVWADPDDPEYLARLEGAGLLGWIADLSAHRAKSKVDETLYYVLPYPDAEVHRAIRMSVEWLLETGSMWEVMRRITSGYEGWPRPGLIPVRKGPYCYGPTCRIEWLPATPPRLYASYRSPALFGIYRYRAESLRPRGDRRTARRRTRRRR